MRATIVISLSLLFAPTTTLAQTLSAQLKQESAVSLAEEAESKGDAVRGAILFSQKKLNCVQCHQPGADDLLGPDLMSLGPDATFEHIVDSMLTPSKVIKKGYESVKVLIDDGTVVVGRVLAQDDSRLTLRDNSDSSRRRDIAKESIERIEQNDVSVMPENLVDQLQSRQQFLDLVRYLAELATSESAEPLGTVRSKQPLSERLQGLAFLDHYRCVRCHKGETGSLVPEAIAPNLVEVVSRVNPVYLHAYIGEPSVLKPGTSMPSLFHRFDEGTRDTMVQAITAYLRTRSDATFRSSPLDDEAAARGQTTFHTVGCVACHSPRSDAGNELPSEAPKSFDANGSRDVNVALGDMTEKYSLESLTAFLENPHEVRPSGRMPNMRLTHWEANDLANYLLRRSDSQSEVSDEIVEAPNSSSPRELDPLEAIGRASYVSLGCASCHETDAEQERFKPLAQLRVDEGCLSSDPNRKVRYELNELERSSIKSALRSLSEPLEDDSRVDAALATLRCYRCHERDGIGGVTAERDLYFHTENQNLGPQGRIPPRLTGVGAKLKPKWMRQVLVTGREIRPYIKTRMPLFGESNVAPLIDALQSTDTLPELAVADVGDPKEARKIGTEIVGRDGLNCVACHTFQYKPAQTMPAVDLTEMGERLKPDWFQQYMRAPQSLSPGTVMPSFWPGGKAIRKDLLDGDVDRQIATIWHYLQEGRQARQPRGVVMEPMQLLATDEAVMLRRSYPGIGKRGIGVGFPAGVNLAFDAEQLRLAMIWKGQFADPGSAFRGQGSGNVRPLSRKVIPFSKGPDLDDAASPWVVDDGRPPRHRFLGYRLDEMRRPAFRYRFDDVDVEDFSVDHLEENSGDWILRRQVRLQASTPAQGLAFRIASGGEIKKLSAGHFQVTPDLQVRVRGDLEPALVNRNGDMQVVIPLDLDPGITELEIDYRWQ